MTNRSHDVTDAELGLLEQLWGLGSATNRQLTDALYPVGPASRYTTVKKLLERLEAKGCVKRDRSSAVQTFAATIEREDLIGRRVQAVAESLCDGSITPILTHVVRTGKLSKKDREQIRSLIDQLDQPTRRKGRRKDK